MQRKGAGAGGLLKSKQQSPAELVEPLDSDEQEQVVKDLKVQIVKQSKRWRIAFCIGYSLIAVIFLFCAAYGSFFPWRFHHQYIFANHLHFAIFQCYYFLSFIVFGFSAKFILVNIFYHNPRYIHYYFIITIPFIFNFLSMC